MKSFRRGAVCHNNPLMVPTIPRRFDEMNVGARIICHHQARKVSGQLHSNQTGLCRPGGLVRQLSSVYRLSAVLVGGSGR